MGLFHVYVEAPERTPEAISQLAETIGTKYGVPVADLEKRLAAGRFRVKANVDRTTADAYAKALSESGAIVKIEDAMPTQPSAVVAPAQPINPVEKSARPGASSLPPKGAARPSASVLPAAAGKSQPVPTSGLSAAYTDSAQKTDLGALSSDSLSLSSLDGNDTGSQPAIQDFAPPPGVTTPAPSPKKAKSRDEPLDLFAPPEAAEDAAFKVEIAADDVAHRAARMSTPPAGVMAVPASPGPATPQLAALKKRQTPAVGAPIIVAPDAQETPRWRFAAGVILAIILGFIPAHLIAASREASAFAKIDQAVHDLQNAVDTPESYEALDGHRDKFLAKKKSERKSLAMQSMLIWAVVGAGIAFAWFRAVPWDKLGKKPAS
ncbi:MAG: hypothetical protein H0T46_08640 [Deltaproteobacteria bacterium]|nr:hypothetical protein [Deltaproteobacteria bacterium]